MTPRRACVRHSSKPHQPVTRARLLKLLLHGIVTGAP